jgi:hypothetical protein
MAAIPTHLYFRVPLYDHRIINDAMTRIPPSEIRPRIRISVQIATVRLFIRIATRAFEATRQIPDHIVKINRRLVRSQIERLLLPSKSFLTLDPEGLNLLTLAFDISLTSSAISSVLQHASQVIDSPQ